MTEILFYRYSAIAGVEEGLAEDRESCKDTSQKNFAGVRMKDAKSQNSKLQQCI